MLPEIEFFIDNYIIDETRDEIKIAFILFDQLELENYNDDFISLMMTESNQEITQPTSEFIILVNKILEDVIILHGITLNPEATLSFKNKLLSAILDLPDYSNKEDLLLVLETQLDEIEKFSELLSYVSTLQVMDLFNNIDALDPSLFIKLTDLINSSNILIQETVLEQQDLSSKIISKLKLIKEMTNYNQALGFTLVNTDVVLGANFDKYKDYAAKHFDLLDNQSIAKEVFIVLTLSKEGYDNPLVTFRKYSEVLFTDLDKITKIDIELNKLLMQYDRFILQKQQS